jgi:hypothetical protein
MPHDPVRLFRDGEYGWASEQAASVGAGSGVP